MKNNEKKSIFISAVIIAIVILLVESIAGWILKDVEIPKLISYIIRAIMYIVTIMFAQFLTQKISAKLKDKK